MEKEVLAAASDYSKKIFFNEEYNNIPKEVKKGIMSIVIDFAKKNKCTFKIGFYDNGDLFLETEGKEDDELYDEITLKHAIGKLREKNKDFFKGLCTWYRIFKTEEGKKILEKEKIKDENKK